MSTPMSRIGVPGSSAMYSSAFVRRRSVGLVGEDLRIRHPSTERNALAGVGAPGDERRQLACVKIDFGVEVRVRIAVQRLPVRRRRRPSPRPRERADGP